MAAPDAHRARLGPQPRPGAGRTGDPLGAPELAVLFEARSAEAVALGAGAVLLAPREEARVGSRQAGAAARAGAPRRVEALAAAGQRHKRAAAELEGLRDRALELARAGALGDARHDRLDVVDLEAVEPRRRRRRMERAVDADLGDALLRGGRDHVLVEALAPPHERREERELASREILGHARGERGHVDDLAGQPALGAVDDAEPRPEQAQVVVDLARGSDGRQRRPARELLLERDRGRHALEAVHFRPRQRPDELAHVGREAVEEAPLPFREQHVERERRLAGARDAGDRDQLVARDLDRDPLQVVLAGAQDADHAGLLDGIGELWAPQEGSSWGHDQACVPCSGGTLVPPDPP